MIAPFVVRNCFAYGGKTTEGVAQDEITELGKRGYEPIQIATAESSASGQKIVILFKFSVVTGEMEKK